jgi:hypothetical protein
MSKYFKLTAYLAELDQGIWESTFSEVEEVLGFALPDSARQYPAWWANQGRSQSLAWQGAGWKTVAVDVDRERVTFLYTSDRDESDDATPSVPRLTISDAKAGLAANFGITPDCIEIHIRA